MDQNQRLFSEAIDIALSQTPAAERRLLLGDTVREILKADVFVSYVCDATGPYADPVEINLGQDMLRAYARHFRHIDVLTPRLFQQSRTSTVTPVPSSCDEFINDFLHSRDMYHGMNYFPAKSQSGSIDLRLWRGRRSAPFTADEAVLLQSLGDLVTRLWPLEKPSTISSLTPRQSQIAELVAQGHGDKQICSLLGISLPTLRTHLTNAFEKTGTRNRAGLAAHFLNSQSR
ncbi:LuxR C-terminal-related transcriptional regulator [Saxibacter everestensis]|uniref:LuxR C-terminal-related transcriptional regulator n=1 Tax=Saxibacter everestensis TaxID=2909229 RepID=A0ABY8QY38_9MICO|nr:LuxR C-terminal-related transcriptional regulator [Brevibacteriaceae bacterium ZFBP1038]